MQTSKVWKKRDYDSVDVALGVEADVSTEGSPAVEALFSDSGTLFDVSVVVWGSSDSAPASGELDLVEEFSVDGCADELDEDSAEG